MKNEHKEFLERDVVKQEKYEHIAKAMNVDRKQLTEWSKELASERKHLANIRRVFKIKILDSNGINKIDDSNILQFNEFRKFYENNNKCCQYCGLTSDEIKELFDKKLIKYSRGGRRGKSLEIDRKDSKKSYSIITNLAWACYWCNNAKTDEFSEEEFKPIGVAIGATLRNRLK